MDGSNNNFEQANPNNGLHLNPAAEAGLTEEQIENPQTAEEYYLDSLSAILRANVGQPVTCEFLIGTNNIVRRDGIIYSSGTNYMALYQPNDSRYVVCDIFSLRFITFYDTLNGDTAARQNAGGAQRSPGTQPWMQNNTGMGQGRIPGGTMAGPAMGNPGQMPGNMPRRPRGGY